MIIRAGVVTSLLYTGLDPGPELAQVLASSLGVEVPEMMREK